MDQHNIPPDLPAEVLFWGVDHDDNGIKSDSKVT